MIVQAPSELERAGYSKVRRAVLDASQIEALGWHPQKANAIEETVNVLRESGQDR